MQPHDHKSRTAANRLLIVRAWRVAQDYHAGRLPKYPRPGKLTRDKLATLLEQDDSTLPWSKAQLDRARQGWPELVSEVWPPLPGMQPPWEDDASLTPPEVLPTPIVQPPLITLREVDEQAVSEPVRLEVTRADGHKEVVEGILQLPLFRPIASLIAASLTIGTVFDAMDGKMDGVIHWCRVLAEMGFRLG